MCLINCIFYIHLIDAWEYIWFPFVSALCIAFFISFQICQVHTQFLHKDKQTIAWEIQHEWAAEKVYELCSELGGFFLKVHFYSSINAFLKYLIFLIKKPGE